MLHFICFCKFEVCLYYYYYYYTATATTISFFKASIAVLVIVEGNPFVKCSIKMQYIAIHFWRSIVYLYIV